MDRPSATAQRCGEVESAIFDLFAQLGASEEQLDFPVLYASAREVGSFPASLLACWRSLGSVSFGRDLFGASLLGEIFLIVDNEREPAVNDGLHDTITSPTRAPDACNLQGWAATALPEPGQPPEGASVAPLLDTIARSVPPPSGDPAAPFALLVAMVEHDAFLGPVATGRVAAGTAVVGDRVRVLHHAGAAPAAVPLSCRLAPILTALPFHRWSRQN